MKLGAMIYSFGPAIRSGEMTQRDVIDFCAELGLACVDTMTGLGDDPWPEVRKMAEDAGLFISCHITSANLATGEPGARTESMDRVRQAIVDAKALGTDKVMVVTGQIPPGDSREATQQRIGEAFRHLIEEEAGPAGVQLCIEDFPGENSPHRTSAELLAVCEIAGPGFGVCFDTGNFYCGGEATEDAWPRLAAKTIHSHLKDWAWDENGRLSTPDGRHFSPELVGRGIVDYPAVLALMKRSGYGGALSFEYEGGMNRAEAAREGIASLRSVLESI